MSPSLKAGFFILAMVAMALTMVVLIGRGKSLLGTDVTYIIEFGQGQDIGGLREDSEVRLYGVPIGHVSDVQVVPDEQQGALARVSIRLPQGFKLDDDAQVFAAASLTGDAWINIDTLGDADALVSEGGTLPGRTRTLGAMLDQVASMVPQAQATLARLDSGLQKFESAAETIQQAAASARDGLPPILDNAKALTSKGAEFATDARELLGDTKSDLRETIANVKDTLGTTRERLPGAFDRMDELLEDTRVLMADARKGFERLPGLIDKVEPTFEHADAFTQQLRSTLADNRPKVDRMIEALTRASEDIKGATSEVRAAPWRLLYKPDERDEKNFVLLALARQYAHGAADLEEAARALQTAAENPATTPEQLEAMRAELETSFNRFDRVQSDLWERFER
jgi:ABC-type transporter Mla subunit MlaD